MPKTKKGVRPLSGNTATYWFSAWSGLKIRVEDEDTVLVQYFFPSKGDTVYLTPKKKQIEYFPHESYNEEMAGFRDEDLDEVFYLNDFMRDSYNEEINQLLAGGM